MNKNNKYIVLALMYLPVLWAVSMLITDFSFNDLAYLICVCILFRNYYNKKNKTIKK